PDFLSSTSRPPPPSSLCPYTTLFRSPLHLERLRLPHERHAIHGPVARRAADAFVDVNAVIEVDEVRQIVDARPQDRLAGAKALRSEEHTLNSSHGSISYAVFCLKKKQ